MKDNKPWYEKVGIWIGIISGVFAILGFSIFGNKSLIKDSEKPNTEVKSEDYQNIDDESSTNNDEESFSNSNTKNQEQNDFVASDTVEQDENDSIEENITEETISPFVTSDPKSDTVINVNLVNWSNEDRDIFGNNYTGNNTMKLSVFNMIYAMGGGSDDITAEIHMPLGERFDATWIINFVVMQDMLGNGSYANVTILSDDQELYPTFTIESDTTAKMEYEVNLDGIRDLVIRFECHAVDSGFCGGVIFNDKEE